jgi:hypothetical protein
MDKEGRHVRRVSRRNAGPQKQREVSIGNDECFDLTWSINRTLHSFAGCQALRRFRIRSPLQAASCMASREKGEP